MMTPHFGVWVLLFPILTLSALAAFDHTTPPQSDLETCALLISGD
jgi:hypothetical protein